MKLVLFSLSELKLIKYHYAFFSAVNTTSRIETTGKPDKIHVSQETAQYLIAAGKEHWLTLREEKVSAKGM